MTVNLPGAWAEQGVCGNYRDFITWNWQKQVKVCTGCPVAEQCRDWALDTYDIAMIKFVIPHGGLIGRELLELKQKRDYPDKIVCRRGHVRDSGNWCNQCKVYTQQKNKLARLGIVEDDEDEAA